MVGWSGANLHMVSVVIPCRNEEKFIEMCLKSIVVNDYPKDGLEVLVVDGMSEDSTRAIVQSWAKQHPSIRLIDNPKKTTPAAMNLGITAARGAVIIIAGAHAEYSADFISNCMHYLSKTGADVVGGPIITKPGANTLIGKAIALARSHPFGVGNSRFRTSSKEGYVDTVPFGAYRREIFKEIGLFNESLARNQDNEMNNRIVKRGRKIYLTPRLTACYYDQATLISFLRHAFSVGMWHIRTVRIAPSALRWRHFAPLVLVMVLVVLGLFGIILPWMRLGFLATLGTYALVAAICSLQIGLRGGGRSAALLPAVFFLYHAAYGVGSWAGLVTVAVTGWKRQWSTCTPDASWP